MLCCDNLRFAIQFRLGFSEHRGGSFFRVSFVAVPSLQAVRAETMVDGFPRAFMFLRRNISFF